MANVTERGDSRDDNPFTASLRAGQVQSSASGQGTAGAIQPFTERRQPDSYSVTPMKYRIFLTDEKGKP